MSDEQTTVHLHQLLGSNLWVATSPDIPGLFVAGRSREQVVAEVPAAIAEIDALANEQGFMP